MENVIEKIMVLGISTTMLIMAKEPIHPLLALRKVQIQILHEVGRTDNWGDPLIWHHAQKHRGRH